MVVSWNQFELNKKCPICQSTNLEFFGNSWNAEKQCDVKKYRCNQCGEQIGVIKNNEEDG